MKEKMMDTNYAFKNSENVFVPKQYTEEKKRTTLLLCIFGGWLGIHRFYAGHYKMGVLYFLTAGVFFVGWIRAIVGGTVAGKEGAVLGGLTGGKGYAVCLNCGKRWKI